ncbi:MAG: molybdopterin-dependent oxidoreductase, partial [Nitrososphaerota archaeon]
MSRSLLSRRDFLKSSLVLGAAVALPGLPIKESLFREISREEAEKLKAEAQQTKTNFINLCMCGGNMGIDNSLAVDVRNGRIIRIRPIHYDWKYKPEEFNADLASFEVNGKIFKSSLKTLPTYYAQAYKNRVYSPGRVKYPLKRVDFDHKAPANRRNVENRGKSGFVRITWEEALNILTSELNRIKETYGPSAILVQGDFHGETKTVHTRPGAVYTFLYNYFGGCTIQARNPDSWEGWYWGGKHVWGMDMTQGLMGNQVNAYYDFMLNGELALFWGCDAETTPNGHGPGPMASVATFWLRDAGKKIVAIAPDLNYTGVIHADKWIPVLPNTDVALHLAIAYVWITEGTYDKKYVETHTFGFEHFRKYVLGEEDGVPKTPKWAEQICGVPARTIKALARTWAKKKTSIFHCNGGPTIRGPYSTEPGRTEIYLLAMQGIGKPGVQQIKMHEWGLFVGWPFANPKVMPTTGAGTRGIFGIVATKPFILKTLTPEGILATPDKPIEWYGAALAIAPVEEQFNKYQFPPEGYP